MPSQYTSPRTRGFAPLFRDSDQHMRVSDAERQAVTDRLAGHFADGRLDQIEFDERAGRAMSAKTRADLAGLLDDLPETGRPDAGLPGTGAPAVPRRRGRSGSFLGLVLLVVIVLAAAHAAMHVVAPLLWGGLIVAVLILAARGRRPRHDQ
jgi:Domain of unknown function (DUF1707)